MSKQILMPQYGLTMEEGAVEKWLIKEGDVINEGDVIAEIVTDKLTNDLVSSDNTYFAATGVTNGDMLRGVTYRANGATTRSLVMRSKSGTIRTIEAVHQTSKLREYARLDI